MSSPSDNELVAAARAGDRAALEVLLERHHDRVWHICRRLTGNDADADDASQDALLAIVRGLGRFDERAAFTTWLYRVATNAALDELRRRRRRPSPTGDELEPRLAAGTAATPSPETATVERAVLDEALRKLPAEYRAAVVLRDVADLEYSEIADILDVPVGTVRSRIARGRAALASSLGGNRPDGPRRPSERP